LEKKYVAPARRSRFLWVERRDDVVSPVRQDEVKVFSQRMVIDALADRIERAYRRSQPRWHAGCSAPGVWKAAASFLLQAHRMDRWAPLDPELYVAAQKVKPLVDPWAELAQQVSVERYLAHVLWIITTLRGEIQQEVALAETRVRQGRSLDSVVLTEDPLHSALGRYIVAARAGRDDLAQQVRRDAVGQHRACPLYRYACLAFLPPGSYPASPAELVPHAPSSVRPEPSRTYAN
jgi:hypothetical protein